MCYNKLMENGQMPPVQPIRTAMPNVMPQATVNGTSMTSQSVVNGMPTMPQGQVTAKNNKPELIKTIAIIAISLVALTFAGLFVWMTIRYNEVSGDVQDKIDAEVAEAKDKQAAEMEAEFLEREKYPYKTFLGPEDYGQLSFEYPRTWSVYIAADAANGGDFRAYFNPVQVNTIDRDTINALELKILDRSFDDVADEYQRYLDNIDANLTMESVIVNGVTANRYSGKIPNTELNGYILIIKIRDKTAVLQTDSVLFEGDFNKIINTITFNA